MEADITSEDNDSDVEEVPQRKSNDKSYKCKTCGKNFSDIYGLKLHEQTHAPDFPYKCPLCPFRAKTKKYISRHNKRMHMEIKGPKCKVCGKAFLFKSKMEEHMMVHTGEKPFKCNYCPKAFRVNYSLKNHLLIHTDEKPYKCSFCNYSCRDNSTLRKHQNKHMGLSKLYNCTQCTKSFDHKYKLTDHLSEVHMNIDIRKHKCPLCDMMFKSRSLVNSHVRIVHDQIYASKCQICGVKVTNKYNLKSHMLSHVDYRPYICTFRGCAQTFKTAGDLKKHTIIHKPDLHHKCNKCDATFTRKHRMEYHKQTHKERKKRVICDYCGVKFYTKNYIIKHIKEVHTDRQPYICDVCGYECRNKPGLVQHIRYSHLECKKENECTMCHTKYKRYEYLKNHFLRTHNIKYKMVRPYKELKVEDEEAEPKSEVTVKVEPIDEDYDTLSLLDIDKEEIQDPEYSRNALTCEENPEYSRNALTSEENPEYSRNVLTCDESEFDQFLVTHMEDSKNGEIDNTEVTEGVSGEVTEDCDPEILRKTNEKVAEMYEMSERLRITEKEATEAKKIEEKQKREAEEISKKNRIKPIKRLERDKLHTKMLIKKNKKEANNCAEKKKIEAKKLAEQKKQGEEEELIKKQEHEFKELEKLRIKYNEIISNMKEAPKKKANKKIIYYKANKNDESNEKTQTENISLDKSDSEEDDFDFTVKPNKLNEKPHYSNELNCKSNNDCNEGEESDKNNDVSSRNDNLSDINNYSEEEISFAVKPTNDENEEANLNIETDVIKDELNDTHDNNGTDIPHNEINKECDESNGIYVENSAKDNHLHDEMKKCVETNGIRVDKEENEDRHDEKNDIRDENSAISNHCVNINDKHDDKNYTNDEFSKSDNICDETNVINDENNESYKDTYTRSGRKLKPRKFFGDEVEKEEQIIGDKNEKQIIGDKNEKQIIGDKNEKQITGNKNEKRVIGDQNEKHPKLNFKSHQCYICFKLYPTEEELIEHCQIHFDICSLKTLTKCPICNYVTQKCLSRHLLKKHDINLKIPFQNIQEKTENSGSKYFLNAEGTIIDVIPSIKALNFKKNKELEKQNRIKKNQAITKTKLIKKGSEWIVQREDLNTDFDLLPEFSETEYKKLKISDNYIDRFKQIYKLTKKRNLKMAFPCLDCPKICLNASALKLHNRLHQNNPAPFKSRKEVRKEKLQKAKIAKEQKETLNIDTRKPKPIKNNHKCDEKLKEFFENNIKGGDIEFWQFLKIYNKMDRENINEFEQLEQRDDFGIHTMEDKRLTVAKNKRKMSNTSNKELNTFKKQNSDSQVPNTSNRSKTLTQNKKRVANTVTKVSNSLKKQRSNK